MHPAPAAQVVMVYSLLFVGVSERGHDHQAENYAARATRFGQRDWLGTATGAQGVSHVGSDQKRSRTSGRRDPACNHKDYEIQEMIDSDPDELMPAQWWDPVSVQRRPLHGLISSREPCSSDGTLHEDIRRVAEKESP